MTDDKIAYVLIGTISVRNHTEEQYIGLRWSEAGLKKLVEAQRELGCWESFEVRVESPDITKRARWYLKGTPDEQD